MPVKLQIDNIRRNSIWYIYQNRDNKSIIAGPCSAGMQR